MPLRAGAADPGRSARDGLRLDGPGRVGGRLGGADRQLADRARAGRRGRLHHAVELPAPSDLRQGRPGPDRGLLRGGEAERGDAADLVHPRRDHRLARPAGRGLQPGHGLRPGRRRGDRGQRRRGHGLLHGLHPRRAARLGGRLADRQAGGARARRQVGERDPRRRGPEGRRGLRRLQLLPELRPDLQRAHADAGPAREAGRGRGDRGGGRREGDARRSLRGRHPARAAGLRGAAGAGAELHREGPGGGRQARHGRRRAAGGPGDRATSCGRRSSPR